MKICLPHRGFPVQNRLLVVGFPLCLPLLAWGQTSSFQGPNYQVSSPAPTGGKYQALADKVAQISANDVRQDVRLYQLEREVDKASAATTKAAAPSPETGTSSTPQLIPYTPYQVRKGDTLWRIAMNHRASPGDIMGFNRMPNDTVVEGQILMIPQKGGRPAATPGPIFFHTVLPNESFRSISKKYGITSEALAKANPKVNPSKLMAGARLSIPGGATLPPPKGKQLAYDHGLPAQSQSKTPASHVVQPGESLSVIAQKHKVTTTSIQTANGITDPNTIRVGQKLIIPGGSTAAVVKNPAKKAKPVTPPAGSSSGKAPAAGSSLADAPTYPTPPVNPPRPSPPPPPPQTNNRGVVAYRMDKGDTIDTVAQTFGTTGAEIRRLNRLSTTSPLQEGDEILVPAMGPVAGN